MATRTHDNTKALYAYIAKIEEVRSTLERLIAFSETNGDTKPENIRWENVREVSQVARLLDDARAEWMGENV